VVADIVGPAGDETDESPPVIGEQRPRRFLEASEIAGHHGHETIRGLLCRAGTIRIAIGAARFLFELMAERGIALKPGQWISSGAVTGVHAVGIGDRIEARFGADLAVGCMIKAS
jgi:hypothetical protein